MPTLLDTIKKSMRLIGALGQSESPTASEATDGMAAANALLESWSIERLMVYQIQQDVYTWASGNASRTIGSSGNFNGTRPTKIENAFTRINDIDYPYQVVDKEIYDAIADKTTQSSYPEVIYFSQASPLATIFGWPVPSASISFYVNSWKQLQQFTSLTTDIAMPAGYQRAFDFNLAIELHAEYPELSLPESVVMIARQSKAVIKSLNTPSMVAQVDWGMRGRPSNIRSDT